MSEYDKSRLYWIKLTDKFFGSDAVDFLMMKKDGANYVVLYQMLCLKTINNGGVLARSLGDVIIPYDVEKIQRDCKWFSSDTVRVALELYKKLGLIYENKDGVFVISEFDRLIGSQSVGAEKKQVQRQNREQAQALEGGQMSAKCPPICPPEKEKEERKEEKEYIHSFVHSIAREEEQYVEDKVALSGLDGKDAEAYREEIKESLKRKYIGGELGKGVVMMSDEQFASLCGMLSLAEIERYFSIIVECEKSGKCFTKKTHYQAIIDMAMEDRRI